MPVHCLSVCSNFLYRDSFVRIFCALRLIMGGVFPLTAHRCGRRQNRRDMPFAALSSQLFVPGVFPVWLASFALPRTGTPVRMDIRQCSTDAQSSGTIFLSSITGFLPHKRTTAPPYRFPCPHCRIPDHTGTTWSVSSRTCQKPSPPLSMPMHTTGACLAHRFRMLFTNRLCSGPVLFPPQC